MARVKGAMMTRKRRNKILKLIFQGLQKHSYQQDGQDTTA